MGVIDERAYLGLFSLATFGVIGWLAWAYSHAFASSVNAGYWTTPV